MEIESIILVNICCSKFSIRIVGDLIIVRSHTVVCNWVDFQSVSNIFQPNVYDLKCQESSDRCCGAFAWAVARAFLSTRIWLIFLSAASGLFETKTPVSALIGASIFFNLRSIPPGNEVVSMMRQKDLAQACHNVVIWCTRVYYFFEK